MSRPPLEVADLIRAAGAAFIERNRQWLSWKHSQSAAGHCAVSHRRTRRSSRSVHPLRTSRHHLLQQLPESTLPEVSDRGPGTVDRSTSSRTSPDALRPCGLHTSSSAGTTGSPEQEGHLRSAVPRQCRNTSRSRSRSADISARRSASSACCTPGIRSSSFTPCPLRGSCRRTLARSQPLG